MSETEIYCSSCGKIIKSEAEICPHWCVRQIKNVPQTSYASDLHTYELQKLAGKDKTTAVILSLLITPLGYVYVGKWGLAIINFITLNYLLLGFIIVPINTCSMISNARKDLDTVGVAY